MNKIEDKFYKNKYPEDYIGHYLAMYSANQKGLSDSNFESHNQMYMSCEGREEFLNLKDEVIKAKQQADLDWFLKVAIFFEIEDIDLNSLNNMFEAIEDFEI